MTEAIPDNFEPKHDTTAIDEEPEFEPEPYCSDEPNDFAGHEFLCVLRTAGSRFTATKSFRPDPSGLRTAVKAADYKSGWLFLCTPTFLENLEQFFELLKELSTDPSAFIVRGIYLGWDAEPKQHPETKRIGFVVYRRGIKGHGADGYFSDWERRLQMLDLDAVTLPEGLSVVTDPEACVKWAVGHLLPPEFRDANFVYQLSSSAGLTKLDNELNVHLWFITERDYGNDDLRAWARWWNAKQQRKIIDPALFQCGAAPLHECAGASRWLGRSSRRPSSRAGLSPSACRSSPYAQPRGGHRRAEVAPQAGNEPLQPLSQSRGKGGA
jgi:hypothetical protein